MMRAAAQSFNPAAVAITGGAMSGVAVSGGSLAGVALSGPITGVATNSNASAGQVGEVITATVASGSSVSLSNGAGTNIASISLTAGDWDVSGQIDFILAGVTATLFQSGISLTSATLPTQPGGGGLGTDGLANVPLLTTVLSATYGQPCGPVRVSVASTTTVFLVADGTFSVGTLTAYGTIYARRMR